MSTTTEEKINVRGYYRNMIINGMKMDRWIKPYTYERLREDKNG